MKPDIRATILIVAVTYGKGVSQPLENTKPPIRRLQQESNPWSYNSGAPILSVAWPRAGNKKAEAVWSPCGRLAVSYLSNFLRLWPRGSRSFVTNKKYLWTWQIIVNFLRIVIYGHGSWFHPFFGNFQYKLERRFVTKTYDFVSKTWLFTIQNCHERKCFFNHGSWFFAFVGTQLALTKGFVT